MRRLALGLALAAPVLLLGAPASAAPDRVTAGKVVDGAVTVTATLDAPRASDRTLAVALGGKEVRSVRYVAEADEGRATEEEVLTLVVRPQVNGRYTATLTDQAEVAPEDPVSAAFDVALPPAAPAGVRVAVEARTGLVAWKPGTEPDLLRYRVEDVAGDEPLVVAEGTPNELCAKDCRVPLGYPGRAASAHEYRVVAVRACPTCAKGAPIEAAAAAVPAAVEAVPEEPEEPTDDGEDREQAEGGTGRTADPGIDSRGFGTAAGPVLEAPRLPGTAPKIAPPVRATPDGTFERLLDYPAPEAAAESVLTEEAPEDPGSLAFAASAAAALLADEGLARSAAAALVLLLLGAHLRRWVDDVR